MHGNSKVGEHTNPTAIHINQVEIVYVFFDLVCWKQVLQESENTSESLFNFSFIKCHNLSFTILVS